MKQWLSKFRWVLLIVVVAVGVALLVLIENYVTGHDVYEALQIPEGTYTLGLVTKKGIEYDIYFDAQSEQRLVCRVKCENVNSIHFDGENEWMEFRSEMPFTLVEGPPQNAWLISLTVYVVGGLVLVFIVGVLYYVFFVIGYTEEYEYDGGDYE